MADESYGQFCPVAIAAEILCTRWTVVLLRELIAGSSRFNELRRGLPRISPTLLSQRLKELEDALIVEKVPVENEQGVFSYHLTQRGRDLQPLIMAFGEWGHRWASSEMMLEKLDAPLLMFDMERTLRFNSINRRRVVQFLYDDAPVAHRKWWVVARPEKTPEMCKVDPGFEVDLYVSCSLRTMTAIWLGMDNVRSARTEGRLLLTGDEKLSATMEEWLGLSAFSKVQKLVA